MRTTLLPLELARWDAASAGELLVVTCWSDVRPMRGAAGLLDWRLDGRLSALLRTGRLNGERGEKLLLPLTSPLISIAGLPWRRALVVGLGELASFDEAAFRGTVASILSTYQALGGGGLAVALPGRDLDRIPAERSLALFLELASAASLPDGEAVALVDALAALKTLSSGLRQQTPTPGLLAPIVASGSAPHKHTAPNPLPSGSESG